MWALDLKKEIDDMLDEHGKSIEPDNDKPKPEQPKEQSIREMTLGMR